jgi:hypothetical protein
MVVRFGREAGCDGQQASAGNGAQEWKENSKSPENSWYFWYNGRVNPALGGVNLLHGR